MDEQNKNLILATALSFLVILVWFVMFPPEPPVETPNAPATTSTVDGTALTPSASGTSSIAPPTPVTEAQARETALAEAVRISIDTPQLKGSISLTGGRLDDLSLKAYRETLDEGSDIVTLLSPQGSNEAYYALYGWSPSGDLTFDDVPGAETVWSLESGTTLTVDSPITLAWDNGKGMTFRREISVDEDFMFSITQSAQNTGDVTRRVAPYGILARHGEPADQKGFFIIQEGPLRHTGEELLEYGYDDVREFEADPVWGKAAEVADVTSNGWLGFTDHYWMTTLIPASDQAFKSVFQHDAKSDIYRATAWLEARDIAPGGTVEVTTQLFAGAKEWATIRAYENQGGVYKFLDSIDWGWFFFLTKPIFAVLHWLNALIGNMGVAIITLTLLIKAILLPLAFKSYVSMAKMKELQPQMEKIKEKAGDDRQKLQKEMMELYKKEKVNPASGCLPILLQIPIFFSLYKVIFVTIELRHKPFFGPFQDLSAPDPTSIFNLFGALPWGAPEPGSIMALIFIGIMPLLLGISMWLQQKLNPAPTDPTQQMIFAWMPWVFMFMLGSFASGLVVYWIANNTITFIQQYAIMRSQGYKPDVLGNVLSSFKKKAKDAPEKK